MPSISIVTPCYNSGRFIERTIESVRRQTFTDWEQVVVDDGSTDNSAAVVAALLPAEPRLRLIRQANGGVANARNNGFRAIASESRYLLFLDADDCLEQRMLEVLFGHLEMETAAGMAFCNFSCIDEMNEPLPAQLADGPEARYVPSWLGYRRLPAEQADTPFVAIFALAVILPSIALLRRQVYEQCGGWDESFGHVFEDTDLFLRVALRSKAHYVPERLVRYRRHARQSTTAAGVMQTQMQKLYTRWLCHPQLTPTEQAHVRSCWRFLTGRLWPLHGFHAGAGRLRQGDLWGALRFWAGAMRRYALSLVGWQPSSANICLGGR